MVAITVTNHAGDGHRQNLFSIRVPELAFTAGLPVELALECAEATGSRTTSRRCRCTRWLAVKPGRFIQIADATVSVRAVTPCHARPAGGDRAPPPADFLLRDGCDKNATDPRSARSFRPSSRTRPASRRATHDPSSAPSARASASASPLAIPLDFLSTFIIYNISHRNYITGPASKRRASGQESAGPAGGDDV